MTTEPAAQVAPGLDLDKLRHALGFRNGKPPRTAYRNNYCAEAGPDLRRLEAHGLMVEIRASTDDDRYTVFAVTRAGMRAIGCTDRFIRQIESMR